MSSSCRPILVSELYEPMNRNLKSTWSRSLCLGKIEVTGNCVKHPAMLKFPYFHIHPNITKSKIKKKKLQEIDRHNEN